MYVALVYARATSHTKLKACDHCILRSLIGRKGQGCPSSIHTRRWRPNCPTKLPWMKKFAWILTWQIMDNVPWSVGICITSTSKRQARRKFRHIVLVFTSNGFSVSHGMVFGLESRALTNTWSQPLTHVWSGPKVHGCQVVVFVVAYPHVFVWTTNEGFLPSLVTFSGQIGVNNGPLLGGVVRWLPTLTQYVWACY